MMKTQADCLQEYADFMNSSIERRKQKENTEIKRDGFRAILNKVNRLAHPLHINKRCF